MKKTLFIGLLILAQISFGQTEKLTKIKGTKCSLIPPKGFVVVTAFSGFQNAEKGASIMINEIPAPYQSIVNGFTAEALKSKGMLLINKQNIDFNGSKAMLINIKQEANGTTYLKQILAFGDAKGTVLVNGIYPEASKDIELEIKDALLSTVFDASQNINALDAAIFSIDTKNTDFQLVKYMSGTLLYSVDGKIPTKKPILIVGNSIAKVPVVNQKRYSIERVKKLPRGELCVIKDINPITIDNLKGFEIVANGKSLDDKDLLVYQVMLFNEKGDYYLIVGQTTDDFNRYLESFKIIAKTFKRK